MHLDVVEHKRLAFAQRRDRHQSVEAAYGMSCGFGGLSAAAPQADDVANEASQAIGHDDQEHDQQRAIDDQEMLDDLWRNECEAKEAQDGKRAQYTARKGTRTQAEQSGRGEPANGYAQQL